MMNASLKTLECNQLLSNVKKSFEGIQEKEEKTLACQVILQVKTTHEARKDECV